jgi:branched-chain amino acid transport system permease protein
VSFFVPLVVDGALAGMVYALIALAFVLVYKASRMINFALGEWVMIGARLVATGVHTLGLSLGGGVGLGVVGMVVLAVTFNRSVVRPLVARPLISLLMVTIGLGILLRGAAAVIFSGVPSRIPLPLWDAPTMLGIGVAPEKLVAAAVAVVCMTAVTWFFRTTRTGLALRAMADDQQTALAVGIDVHRHLGFAWAMAGGLAAVAGTLWSVAAGGGFGLVLLGLRVFPIVVVGGLDSIPGTIISAVGMGVLESLTVGYLDPILGAGFSTVVSYVVLLAVLLIRPYGLFGRPAIERI